MSNLKNKMILILSIFIVMSVFLTVSYYTNLYYKSYTTVQNRTKLSSFLTELDSVLYKIEAERINSVIYLISQRKNNFDTLKETRVEVDLTMARFVTFLKQSSEYEIYSKKIFLITAELKRVRIEVDKVSGDYRNILFQDYHFNIVGELLEILKRVSIVQKSEQTKIYLSMYEKYAELKENLVLENTGIYFVLLGSRKMSDADIVLWEQVISKDILPRFELSINRTLTDEIEALLSAEEFSAITSRERDIILTELRQGSYSVSLVGWLNKGKKKFDYLTKVQSLILAEIQKIEQSSIYKSQMILLLCGIGLLVLLLFLLRLFVMYFKINKNRQISKETLKDIALVFNKNQQHEIQRLIRNGKVDHIYKFLIKAILDANQTKDLFLASMSHEIRTPLNGILGFTQLLKESDDKEEQAEFISVIEKSSGNLLSIVNDILDLSKIKAEKIELESIEFDPIDSFEAAVESYAAKAAEEHIDLNVFLDPQLPTLLIGDPTKISQVIVNLVSNAIKFTSTNGEVNVNIEKLSENADEVKVKFEVSDTGIGITKAQKSKIFEAFSQADVSTSREYGGTGLGLSISGKFVALMGGKLSIWSEKDEGSSFYFTLAFNKPECAVHREISDMSAYTVGILSAHIDTEYYIDKNLESYIAYTGAKIAHYTDESLLALKGSPQLPDILFIDHKFRLRGGEIEQFLDFNTKTVVMSTGDQKRNLKRYRSRIDRILYKPINLSKTLRILNDKEEISESEDKITFDNVHVLVAEDNSINQKLIVNVLNRLGVEVSIANNGQEALDLRKINEYDMIFMDIEMPVMGGMEATGQILNYERKNHERHIPVVALTANALSGDREKYMGAGMNDYLSKPIHLDELNVLLKEYFEERIVEGDVYV